MNNILSLQGISKSFVNKNVLENINFEVKENEIFGIIGLNGAGKTTLIKIIINLLNADFGEGFICNTNIKNFESRENISYLPEKFQPSNVLKGIEFLNIFCESNLDVGKIKNYCELVDLSYDVLGEKIANYSKGMIQKIGLIVSVLEEKKLLILDEPMTGLDPKARIFLKELLLNYKTNGKSIFFSSHILSDIDEICDRIAVLNDGKIVFIGTPKQLKESQNESILEKAFLKSILN